MFNVSTLRWNNQNQSFLKLSDRPLSHISHIVSMFIYD